MGSPLGLALVNPFLCYHEKRWLDKCPEDYFNSCLKNIKFTSEKETNNKLSFLNIEISRDKNQFITSVYRKSRFTGVFSHCDSHNPTAKNSTKHGL